MRLAILYGLALFACGARASESGLRESLPRRAPPLGLPAPHNLECTNLRRLSDNFLLDLKIRFMFRRDARSYLRLENAGRGWHVVDERPYASLTGTRLVLAEGPDFIAYVERLTGDYYNIDHTGAGLSLWGRCVPVFNLQRQF